MARTHFLATNHSERVVGYSQRWYTPPTITPAAWQRFTALVIALLRDAPTTVPFGEPSVSTPLVLCDPSGADVPTVSDRAIAFNGDRRAGLAGEAFRVVRVPAVRELMRGRGFGFCKTGLLPYDVLVVACLCALKSAVPGVTLDSNGSLARLAAGRRLFEDITHFPAPAWDQTDEACDDEGR